MSFTIEPVKSRKDMNASLQGQIDALSRAVKKDPEIFRTEEQEKAGGMTMVDYNISMNESNVRSVKRLLDNEVYTRSTLN